MRLRALETSQAGQAPLEHSLVCSSKTKSSLLVENYHSSSLSCHSPSCLRQTYQHKPGVRKVVDEPVQHGLDYCCQIPIDGLILHECLQLWWLTPYFSWQGFVRACEHFDDPQGLVNYKTSFDSSCKRIFGVRRLDYEAMMMKMMMVQGQVLG